jgi:DNA-binding response OmpR family regulator
MATGDASLTGRRVLIVEDTFVIATELEHALRKFGCEVIGPCATVETGASGARTEPIDLALLDLNLDGELVYPVAHELLLRGIPFVFLTGYGGESIDELFRGAPCLTKPFGLSELKQVMCAVLAAPRERASH